MASVFAQAEHQATILTGIPSFDSSNMLVLVPQSSTYVQSYELHDDISCTPFCIPSIRCRSRLQIFEFQGSRHFFERAAQLEKVTQIKQVSFDLRRYQQWNHGSCRTSAIVARIVGSRVSTVFRSLTSASVSWSSTHP